MLKKGLGYVIGDGESFFGSHYTTSLDNKNFSNFEELNYIVYYSVGLVSKTYKSESLPYSLALKEKERILNETENLVQLWLYCDEIKHRTFGSFINQKLKQIYKDYKTNFNLGGFRLALYNKDCFIEDHNDGVDVNRTFVMIFYLSKDWENGMGGELVITDVGGNEIVVTPEFGNFAIFDFKEANLQHRVNKITDDGFNRTSLIEFVFEN